MNRLPTLLLPLCLSLSLISCSLSPKEETSFRLNLSLTQPSLQSDAFSEPLEPLEEDLAWMLYGLEETGLTREDMTGVCAFRSTGATCEELALFGFSGQDAAKTAMDALNAYLQSQIQSNRDYRPAEVPKLEKAFLEQRGTSVLLLVAADYEAAYALLES